MQYSFFLLVSVGHVFSLTLSTIQKTRFWDANFESFFGLYDCTTKGRLTLAVLIYIAHIILAFEAC